MTVKVTKDRIAEVRKLIENLTGRRVLVGVAAESAADWRDPGTGSGEPVTNAQLGYIHEFGAPEANIPARPFLIPGVTGIKDQIIKRMKEAGQAALAGDQARMEARLSALGAIAVDAVQQKMVDGPFIPLSPITIWHRERRGVTRTNPLMDTGALRQSINFTIAKKKG